MSWGNFTKEELDKSFSLEYKSAFRDMVTMHVREEDRKQFLESVFYATNQNASSTVWGAVLEVAEEFFGYNYAKDLFHKVR